MPTETNVLCRNSDRSQSWVTCKNFHTQNANHACGRFFFLLRLPCHGSLKRCYCSAQKMFFYFGMYVYSANDNRIRSFDTKTTYCRTGKKILWNINTCARMHKRNQQNQITPTCTKSLSLCRSVIVNSCSFSLAFNLVFSQLDSSEKRARTFRLPVCCWCFVHSLHISTHHRIKSTTSTTLSTFNKPI